MKLFIQTLLLVFVSNLFSQELRETIIYKVDTSYTVSNNHGRLNIQIKTDSTNLGKRYSLSAINMGLNMKAISYELWDRTNEGKVILFFSLNHCEIKNVKIVQDFNSLSPHCSAALESLFNIFFEKYPRVCINDLEDVSFRIPIIFKLY